MQKCVICFDAFVRCIWDCTVFWNSYLFSNYRNSRLSSNCSIVLSSVKKTLFLRNDRHIFFISFHLNWFDYFDSCPSYIEALWGQKFCPMILVRGIKTSWIIFFFECRTWNLYHELTLKDMQFLLPSKPRTLHPWKCCHSLLCQKECK